VGLCVHSNGLRVDLVAEAVAVRRSCSGILIPAYTKHPYGERGARGACAKAGMCLMNLAKYHCSLSLLLKRALPAARAVRSYCTRP